MTSAIVTFSSCRRDTDGYGSFGNVSSTEEMNVPEGFSYKTTNHINFQFSTSDLWGKEKLRLDIFDFRPSADGEMLSSLFLDGFGEVTGSLEVPNGVKELYAVLNYPDGSSTMAKVEIEGNGISYDFSDKKSMVKKVTAISPNCTSGCNTMISGNNTLYNADNGGLYCFTGSISQGITASNGSTVRICGSGDFELIVESGASVEIIDGANITITNLKLDATAEKITIYPNAVMNVANWAIPNADIINHGTINFVNLGINAGCTLTNNGNLQVTGLGSYDITGGFINNGNAQIAGNLTLKAGGKLQNHCSLVVAKQLKLDAPANNFCYLKVDGTLNIIGSGSLRLHNHAMVSIENMSLNGSVEGFGSTSLVKLKDKIQGNSSGEIKGSVELCDANGMESNFYGKLVAPAVMGCGVYVAVTPCNPEGNGSPDFRDDDFDGVSNKMDLYPVDADVSGVSYYPSDSTFATLLFEDLWPGKGDFDFNDLVLGYSHSLVTNALNKVVRVESKFVVKAIGGSLKNGFGFQFNVNPTTVASVTGQLFSRNIVALNPNGTEKNQSKATIIVFDNAFLGIQGGAGGTQYVNTITTEPQRTYDTITIVTTFTTPQLIETLGDGPFNPFIFINGDRGRELHLVNNPPTNLVKTSYFQSASDDSDPETGRYYKSDGGHPWVLNVKSDIDYMQEKLDIVQGYNFFATWAQSGGSQASDWYIEHTGYRDEAKLF